MLFDVESFYDSISLSLVARAGLKLAYSPVLLGLNTTHTRRGSLPHRRVAAVSARRLVISNPGSGSRMRIKGTTLRDWRSTTWTQKSQDG